MERITPIETYYRGRRFRSRLEARWAVFFDALSIKWIYEPEGLKLSDGTCYLPDFYLPETDSFFEVKGLMSNKDLHKIEQLIRDTDKRVTVGYDNCEFEATERLLRIGIARRDTSMLYHCSKCGAWIFHGTDLAMLKLPCCGCEASTITGTFDFDTGTDSREFVRIAVPVVSGDGYMTKGMYSSALGNAFKKAANAFLSARFEHGETPIACTL